MRVKKNIYHPGTAGKIMTSKVPVALKDETVKNVIVRIRKNWDNFDTINYVYITESSALLGIVSIKKLLFSKDNTLMNDLMRINFSYVLPETKEEDVADLIIKKNIKAIPVIKKKVFIGVVPNDKILTILKKDFSKNIIDLSGVHDKVLEYKSASEIPFFESIKLRLPWLIIGLIGITFAAGFINIFEEILSEHLIIAFFIPAIVYMSGAIGSQHQTLLIRDLALMEKNLDIKKYFLKVIITGSILGLIIGLSVFLIIALFWGESFMGLIIGVSMMIALIISSFTSITITYSINKFKIDPAIGSGPFATIISDVFSIIIYFLIMSLLINT